MWGSCFWFCIPAAAAVFGCHRCPSRKVDFVKNRAYFGKNRPYFLTGRWAAAWAKFGSTFFPHIFVWGYCFWFCIPPPPFLVATVARQEIRSIFAKISLIFDKNRSYFLTQRWQPKTSAVCLERTSVRVFGCHRCPSKNKVDFCQNKAYFGKNQPYFLTGRWVAAWAKFGSTFFPTSLCGVLVFGSVSRRRLLLCLPPLPPTTCPHTSCSHRTCPHQIAHTHNLSTHNLSSHNLLTHNLS